MSHMSEGNKFLLVRLNNANYEKPEKLGMRMTNRVAGGACKLKPTGGTSEEPTYRLDDMLLTQEQCEELFAPRKRGGIHIEE